MLLTGAEKYLIYLARITKFENSVLEQFLRSACISEQCLITVLGTESSVADWQGPEEHQRTWSTSEQLREQL